MRAASSSTETKACQTKNGSTYPFLQELFLMDEGGKRTERSVEQTAIRPTSIITKKLQASQIGQ